MGRKRKGSKNTPSTSSATSPDHKKVKSEDSEDEDSEQGDEAGKEGETNELTNIRKLLQDVLKKQSEIQAGLEKRIDSGSSDLRKRIETINQMFSSFEVRISAKCDDIKKDVDTVKNELKDEMALQLGVLNSKIESLEERLVKVELGHANISGGAQSLPPRHHKDFDPEVTIVVTGLRYDTGEDLNAKVHSLLTTLNLGELDVVQVMRTKWRNGKPGIVKMQMASLEDKLSVLRAKMQLREVPQYSNIYIRSSKTHEERLMEINMRQLLDEIPNGRSFRFTGSGRLVRKDQQHLQADQWPSLNQARAQPGSRRWSEVTRDQGGGTGSRTRLTSQDAYRPPPNTANQGLAAPPRPETSMDDQQNGGPTPVAPPRGRRPSSPRASYND